VSVGGGRDRSVLVWATDFHGSKARVEDSKVSRTEFSKEKQQLEIDLVDSTKESKERAKEERKRKDIEWQDNKIKNDKDPGFDPFDLFLKYDPNDEQNFHSMCWAWKK
jgi:hypothetical protein